MGDIKLWPTLCKLDSKLLCSIKFVFVFGGCGSETIILTQDDDIFAYGTNRNGCCGVGTFKTVSAPTKIETLCKKGVFDMCFGWGFGTHVVALTKFGHIFTWGYNNDGQLGNGTCIDSCVPRRVSVGKRIIGISCGGHHTLVLTENNEVYSWGSNSFGQLGVGLSIDHQSKPVKVNSLKDIIAISCGFYFSVALQRNGHVYGWGLNTCGQLGINNNVIQYHPIRIINLGLNFIEKVVCGYHHTLLLTDGVILSMGNNAFAQLGNGNTKNQSSPIKITDKSRVKFVAIWASPFSNMSIALSSDSNYYVWGQCREQIIKVPQKTKLNSFYDVISILSFPKITWGPFKMPII